jgi:hypothetical protein
MGALMRSTDWSKTSIGAIECWSPALRMMVRLLLANRFPLLLWWGRAIANSITIRIGRSSGTSIPRPWASRRGNVSLRYGTSSAHSSIRL